jgi:23S rRNA (adenine2503-C2)-methyltransferase
MEHPVSETHPHRRGEDPLPWNIVVMGMGEPLLNYDATVAALRVLMDKDGFGIAPRKLTLSTVGILPALERLAQEPVRPNLAISLHAPDPGLRRALMPIEEKYAMGDVIDAALRYPIPRGGLVTFEYVLLGGVNDTAAHARELARRLSGKKVKVNLIPLNPAPEIPFQAPTATAIGAFCATLADTGVAVSVRRSRGLDILAACGQLHLKQGVAAPVPLHP